MPTKLTIEIPTESKNMVSAPVETSSPLVSPSELPTPRQPLSKKDILFYSMPGAQIFTFKTEETSHHLRDLKKMHAPKDPEAPRRRGFLYS